MKIVKKKPIWVLGGEVGRKEGYIPNGLHPHFVSPVIDGGCSRWGTCYAPLTAQNLVPSPRILRKVHPSAGIILTSGHRFIQAVGIVSDLKEEEEGIWVCSVLVRGRWAISSPRTFCR